MPDVIYINGNIWTGSTRESRAEAIAIKGETIVAIGSNTKIESLKNEKTKVIDLKGKFVVPGFIDNHTHFISGGFQLIGVNLRDVDSPKEFIHRISQYAADLHEGQWITGGDWDHEKWGGELPHRSWIDSVTTDIPVFISRLDGHMGLANSKALDLAGITSETPDPEGGTIVRDTETGEPTGILKDEAMSAIFAAIPEPSEEELDEALQRAMDYAVSKGVTQIHDMGGWEEFETYQRAEKKGKLKIRVYAFVWITNWQRMIDYVKFYGNGNNWLRWGGIKAMVDGSLGSGTAWFYDPYLDNPGSTGLMVADTSELKRIIYEVDRAGLHLAVHAIGDRANDWLLDVYEEVSIKNGPRDRRFRIEHAQHLTKDAIKRFATLNVIASMQPYHCIDDGRWAEKRVGPEVIKTTYAFRSLLDAGVRLTFGSDWTVAPINPLEGIYAAVTRRTLDGAHPNGWVPEQKISVEEALRCYTSANAYASFQENRLGTLEPGKFADFVVLSDDLFNIDPVEIADVEILRTVVGGKDRYIAVTSQ